MKPCDRSCSPLSITYGQKHEIVDRGLIKDSFFGGYFTVTRKIGKAIKGYYTPFHAEPFGSIAEMEQAKPDDAARYREGQSVSRQQ